MKMPTAMWMLASARLQNGLPEWAVKAERRKAFVAAGNCLIELNLGNL
jgi:hypothetical protein